MGVPTDTLESYAVVGMREDLSDMITNISPVDTQFFSSLQNSKNSVKNKKHEWLTDTLAAATDNARIEGDERANIAVVAATRLYNMMQIQSKTFQISDSELAMTTAGNVGSEDYQTTKFTKELAKDCEYAFLLGVRADGSSGVARGMRGAVNWITTNLSKDAGATLNADGTVTGGSTRALTEDLILGVLQSAYVAGGNPSIAYCGAFQKRQVSSFAGSGNYRTAVEEKKLNNTIDIYVCDFGTITFKLHRIITTSVVIFIDSEYWSKATLRPTQKRYFAKTTDSTRIDITVEHTLEANAETANARITSLTTS